MLAVKAATRAAGILASSVQQLSAHGFSQLDAAAALLLGGGDLAQAWQKGSDCKAYGGAANVWADLQAGRPAVDWEERKKVRACWGWSGHQPAADGCYCWVLLSCVA